MAKREPSASFRVGLFLMSSIAFFRSIRPSANSYKHIAIAITMQF